MNAATIKAALDDAEPFPSLDDEAAAPKMNGSAHANGADAQAQTKQRAAEDAAEITRLAALPLLDYERERKAAAARLDIRESVLDKLVAAERGDDEDTADSGQGRALRFPEIEPWPEPVDGAELIADIAAGVSRYVVTEKGTPETVAAWVLHTFAYEAFNCTPRLAITSPEPRCGKTTLLDVVGCLVPRALPAANTTAAALFRAIELARPSVLIDEADTFLAANDELRGILNAGHRKGGSVLRVIGDDHEPRQFSVFAPVLIAMIGNLPATLIDRSVSVRMRRRRADEHVEGFRLDRVADLERLSQRAQRWADDNRVRLAGADPAMPDGVFNRAADNWRPLLAVADIAGGDWPRRLRDIAANTVALVDNQTTRGMLLSDIAAIFSASPDAPKALPSAFLCDELGKLEDRPWPEFRNGKPITPRQLAQLLAPFGIRPDTKRDGGAPFKGYALAVFEETFSRYGVAPLGSPASDPLQRYNPSGEPVSADRDPLHGSEAVTDGNPQNPRFSAACNAVTDEIPPPWELEP